MKTFKYFMDAYFYQDWMSEYSDANDLKVLTQFAKNEDLEIVNKFILYIKYVLKNNIAKNVFRNGDFDFDPLTHGYEDEREWFKTACKTLVIELEKK